MPFGGTRFEDKFGRTGEWGNLMDRAGSSQGAAKSSRSGATQRPPVAKVKVSTRPRTGLPPPAETENPPVADRERAEAERLRLENALRESDHRLVTALAKVRQVQNEITHEERLNALRLMARGVAHDFNNDLAMIVGFTEILLKRPEDLQNVEKTQVYLKMIRSVAGDATAVVERLQEFIHQREESDVPISVNLNQLIEQAILLTQPKWKYQDRANKTKIAIELKLQPVPSISGNPAELRESLTNLILNAVDAMPDGGTLTIASRVAGDRIRVDVGDTGVGVIDDVELDLSSVSGAVERHAGTMAINSQTGKGTTFVIQLPVKEPRGHSKKARTSSQKTKRTRRILVVEDEAPLRRILREYLAFDGYLVETAVNGRDGLSRFVEAEADPSGKGKFDLVVTDLAMPEMSGDQLALAVKEVSPSMSVILLTGFGEMMLTAEETPPGVDLIVPKPFSLASLQQAVARVLGA